MDDGPSEIDARTDELLERLEGGDRGAFDELLGAYRDRLLQMVRFRLDRRVQGRLEASDVVQEAYIEAAERIKDYLLSPDMPFYVWLRFITAQKVLQVHRRHLRARQRDARREVRMDRAPVLGATSAAMARELVGDVTSPSEAAMRSERERELEEALDGLGPLDREVLALRHFEQLSNKETAEVLGMDESATSKRYLRALRKLKRCMRGPGDTP